LRNRRPALLALAADHGTSNVRLFGSVRRGEQRPTSDVDLLVDLDEGRTLLDLTAFGEDASELLGVPVDVATSDMLKARVRRKIVADAIQL
jgi:predicted nucleotidyltransferase